VLDLQGWELGLLAVAAFIAITALVRLMQARRDQLTNELLAQAEAEHHRQQEVDRKTKLKLRRSP
jgi:hypothetical protein